MGEQLHAEYATALERTVAWLGIPWDPSQSDALLRYAEWLSSEAVAIGGMGPHEANRIWRRHVLDSLVFGRGMEATAKLLDVGSGVGLPGIPLAVAFPDSAVTLVDRSGRRCDAAARAARIARVHVRILQKDVMGHHEQCDRIVFRASLRLHDAVETCGRLLSEGGEGWFGLGRGAKPASLSLWRENPPPVPHALAVSEVEVPPGILDSPVWLLRIARL